jgi:glycine/D-amino acid oxidase-like deaminating enzyme
MHQTVTAPSKSWRIAVVGAGAAGLTCAHALKRAGFDRVTVFEGTDRVGGKCCTIEHEGRTLELGAGGASASYYKVRELLREHDVRAEFSGARGYFIEPANGRGRFMPPPMRGLGLFRVAANVTRFLRIAARHASALEPGFDGVDPSLAVPFKDWARARGCEIAAEMIEPWFTGFGYGYFDEIPAAYVLKYSALIRLPMYELRDVGYQGLWERVAARLDVRTGTRVQRVRRAESGVVVTVRERDEPFDALIVACPLDGALGFLDATPDERELFSAVRNIDYHVVGIPMRSPPKARYGFVADHLRREHGGKPSFFYRRWLDRDFVLFYALPPPGASLEDTVEATRRLVADLGGASDGQIVSRAWKYFPHVDSATMAAGFYRRLEGLQGQRRTWLAGEVFSFSAVEPVVAYSQAMVNRCFVSRPASA